MLQLHSCSRPLEHRFHANEYGPLARNRRQNFTFTSIGEGLSKKYRHLTNQLVLEYRLELNGGNGCADFRVPLEQVNDL
jgi:hypothetical protein